MKQNIQNIILSGCAVILTLLIIWVVLFPQSPFIYPEVQQPQPRFLPDYPINMQVTSYLGNASLDEALVPLNMGDKLISVLTKVTYDEKSQQYTYNYKIGYLGKQPIFVSWGIFDRILSGSPVGGNVLIPIEPESTTEFTFSSNRPPTMSNGNAWLYRSRTLEDGKTVVWDLVSLDAQPGPLPKE